MNNDPYRRISSRRDFLWRSACGMGGVALTALAQHPAYADHRNGAGLSPVGDDRNQDQNGLHHVARAKNVIFLYMDGGPAQMDTFDPKPRLQAEHGQPFAMKMEPTQFNNNGNTLGSPWKFQNYGESGLPISSLFPYVAKHADKLAVIRSMTSEFSEHTNGNYFLHSGSGFQGRPSMGAWVGYGLGSESLDLPGFVVLNGGLIPPGGLDCFGSGFLPAAFQGSVFSHGPYPVANIQPPENRRAAQASTLDLIRSLDREYLENLPKKNDVEAAISNFELAFRMQGKVPEIMDLSAETATTLTSYGVDATNEATRIFGRQCLIARRMVEAGVRFIELTCPSVGSDRWDQHSNLKGGHEANALAVDQPIGALLEDLEQRGLLHETLIVWAGEFGRTPFAQGSDGRDHNPFGFSLWMAGGGVKGGTTYGATDEYGYKAIEGKLQIHDLHATMLHLLGVDHKKLTYRWGGRDMRLTDVHGKVVDAIVA
ncbi:MAG: DUF1501 domain-containing protein [Planctomycetaceae bacterium]|nr:DUF1501 domain-containing protein [Planctomycetaceae bacterium]